MATSSIGMLAVGGQLGHRSDVPWLFPLALAVGILGAVLPYFFVLTPKSALQVLAPKNRQPLTSTEAAEALSKIGAALSVTPAIYGLVCFAITGRHFWPFVAIAAVTAIAYWNRIGELIGFINSQGDAA